MSTKIEFFRNFIADLDKSRRFREKGGEAFYRRQFLQWFLSQCAPRMAIKSRSPFSRTTIKGKYVTKQKIRHIS